MSNLIYFSCGKNDDFAPAAGESFFECRINSVKFKTENVGYSEEISPVTQQSSYRMTANGLDSLGLPVYISIVFDRVEKREHPVFLYYLLHNTFSYGNPSLLIAGLPIFEITEIRNKFISGKTNCQLHHNGGGQINITDGNFQYVHKNN